MGSLYLAKARSISKFSVQFSSLLIENGRRLIAGPLQERFRQRQMKMSTATMTTLAIVSATEAMNRLSDHLSQAVFVRLGSVAAASSSKQSRILIDLARKRIFVRISMQMSRSTRVREVASGRFSRTMGWTAAQAIIRAATLMILFMISVVWQKTQTLMKPSSQMGMKMVIMSTTGKRQSGILKMAYLKGLKVSCMGCLSSNTTSLPCASPKLITYRSSNVQAYMQVSATSYFPKLFIAALVIMGASSFIFCSLERLGFDIGSSSLKLLKLILLMCILLSSFSRLSSLPYSASIPLFSSLTQVDCLCLFPSSSQSNISISMWSSSIVRSRLMKLYGAQNSSLAELLMISTVNSFRIRWKTLHPSTGLPPLLYVTLDLKAWIWNSFDRVVGSLTVTSLLKVTGRKLDFLSIFFFRFFSRTSCSSGFQQRRSRSMSSRCWLCVKIKKLMQSSPLTCALRFSKLTSVKFFILNCTHAGTTISSGCFSTCSTRKHSQMD